MHATIDFYTCSVHLFFRICEIILMAILALVTNFVLYKYWTRPNHQFVKTEVETKEISFKTSKGDFQTKVSEYENGRVKIYWELNDMSQDNPILIEMIKNEILISPSKSPQLNLKAEERYLDGQYDQVPFIEKVLGLDQSKKDYPGFYIEAGAADGKTISNSLYFELEYGWTGLLVEPNPDYFEDLVNVNRNAWILPHCLSTKPHVETVVFDVSDILSGIMVDGKKPSHLNDKYLLDFIYRMVTPEKPYAREIEVQCFPLYSVLMALGNPHVDYFSLDIEGAEAPVLQNLPWDKVNVTSWTIEINHAGEIFPESQEDIRQLMYRKGYDLVGALHIDDVFFKKEINRF